MDSLINKIMARNLDHLLNTWWIQEKNISKEDLNITDIDLSLPEEEFKALIRERRIDLLD